MFTSSNLNKIVVEDLKADIEQEEKIAIENNDDNEIPEDEENFFSSDTMQQIIKAKQDMPSNFESYWENDENDIDKWSKKQIDEDPGKQLLVHAEYGEMEELIKLVNDQPDEKAIVNLLKYQDSDGYTALHRAAYSNQLEVAKYLMKFQNNPKMSDLNILDVKTEMGWTPLHSAVYWNCYEMVEYFFKYSKANVNAKTSGGQTALHLAATQSDIRESLIILLTHPRILFGEKNEQDETALQLANRQSKYHNLFEIASPNLNFI